MSIFQPLPTLTISKKKKYLQAYFIKLAATSILYVSLFLLTFSDFLNAQFDMEQRSAVKVGGEHLTYAMSINTYSRQKLENLQLDHKEK